MDEPVQRVDRIFDYDDGHTQQVFHVSILTLDHQQSSHLTGLQ